MQGAKGLKFSSLNKVSKNEQTEASHRKNWIIFTTGLAEILWNVPSIIYANNQLHQFQDIQLQIGSSSAGNICGGESVGWIHSSDSAWLLTAMQAVAAGANTIPTCIW